MIAIQIQAFDPVAALGVRLDLKTSVAEPMFLATAAVSIVAVPLVEPERSARGRDVLARLHDESLLGAASLATLVAQPGQLTLERIHSVTQAVWIEALGTVYAGQLFGRFSAENDYVVIAARDPRGTWRLSFRWLDDPRTKTDYVGVLYSSS